MIFRGVELINPVEVPNAWNGKVEVYFDNILPHKVREEWSVAGYPVYWDMISKKSYIAVDPKDLLEHTKVVGKCDFGCSATGSLRHHWMCSAFVEET